MKDQWKVIGIIVLLIFVVVFALQNTNSVVLDLMFVNFSIPLVLVILISILIGAIVGLATSLSTIRSNQQKVKELGQDNRRLEADYDKEIKEKDKRIAELEAELKGPQEEPSDELVPGEGYEVLDGEGEDYEIYDPELEDPELEEDPGQVLE